MKREYHCDLCNRKLPHERWIFSQHTKARYCWPGECGHDKRKRKVRTNPPLRKIKDGKIITEPGTQMVLA
jgi:hypothetical protein